MYLGHSLAHVDSHVEISCTFSYFHMSRRHVNVAHVHSCVIFDTGLPGVRRNLVPPANFLSAPVVCRQWSTFSLYRWKVQLANPVNIKSQVFIVLWFSGSRSTWLAWTLPTKWILSTTSCPHWPMPQTSSPLLTTGGKPWKTRFPKIAPKSHTRSSTKSSPNSSTGESLIS